MFILYGDIMTFERYSKIFRDRALAMKKSEGYIKSCLSYAERLFENKLPVIYDDQHFSLLLGIRLDILLAISNAQNKFYRYFTIPKHNGERRPIAEPLPMLKEIQHFILTNILYKLSCSPYSKAYVQNSSIKENAKFHRNQHTLVKLDIQDYFNSLHESQVMSFFSSLGYSVSVSVLLTKLCTLNKGLPQGAPTSPYLSNLLTVNMDIAIYKHCSQYGNLRYTRYADDISISGEFDPAIIIRGVSKIVEASHLHINKQKTAVIGQQNKQIVTGIVVNDRLQAPKSYRRSIRIEMYYCMKHGVKSHLKKSPKYLEKICERKYCEIMLGKVNHCIKINKKDREMLIYRDYLLNEINNNARANI